MKRIVIKTEETVALNKVKATDFIVLVTDSGLGILIPSNYSLLYKAFIFDDNLSIGDCWSDNKGKYENTVKQWMKYFGESATFYAFSSLKEVCEFYLNNLKK